MAEVLEPRCSLEVVALAPPGPRAADAASAAHGQRDDDCGESDLPAASLPLDVLAAIARLDIRGLAAHIRPVCRDWRLAFDSVVTVLACTAPEEPHAGGRRRSGRGNNGAAGSGAAEGGVGGRHVEADASNGQKITLGCSDAGVGSTASGDGGSIGVDASKQAACSCAAGGGEGGSQACGADHSQAGAQGGSPRAAARQLLPLAFERLTSCDLEHVPSDAALRRVAAALAAGSPSLARLRLGDSGGVTELPADVARLAGLVRLTVNWTAVAVLPAGLGSLSQLEVLDLSFNQLQQLPQSLGALPRLRSLLADHNLLTELPPLPAGLSRLDVSYNRLRGLGQDLTRLHMLTSLAAVRAFSHPPRGEGGPVVAALARLAAARGGGAVALRVDGGVAEAVRTRARLLLGDGGALVRVVGDG